MTRNRILAPLLFLLVPALLPAQLSYNQAIALEYARQALDLMGRDLSTEAYLLAGRGLGFDETSSDLHYLRAVSGAPDQSRTRNVQEHLEAALGLDTWRLIDEQDGVRSLLSLYLRLGEYEAAAELLPTLRLRRPEDYRLSTQVLRLSGEFAAADDVYLRGRRLYPQDPGLFRFGLSLDRAADPAERRWLDRNASESSSYLAALLDFILISPSVDERQELLGHYFASGGDHPLAYGANLEAAVSRGDSTDIETAFDRFVAAEAFRNRSALAWASRSLGELPQLEELRGILSEYSGSIIEDGNRDGFYESRFDLREGTVRSWNVDRNTDGVHEWVLLFEASLPSAVERVLEGGAYRVHYHDYPEAAAVTFEEEPGAPTYYLLPGSTDYAVLPPGDLRGKSTLELVTALRLADAPSVLSASSVARSAYLIDFQDDSGAQVAQVLIDRGRPVRRFEDATGDGRIDAVFDYVSGVISAGVRDPDEDGYFEVTEQYLDGRLATLLVDEDDDFVVEYREVFGDPGRGTPTIYSWDLDEDGVVDMQEIVLNRDRLLDGFDTSASGAIVITFDDVERVFAP